ncbi:MAG: ABC transporter permease [Methylotenera sp.]|nr:ABC transporter permease [Oligoflexia bacterium]
MKLHKVFFSTQKLSQRFSAVWLFAWYGAALFVYFKTPHESFQLTHLLRTPTWAHPFGWDPFGRDVLGLTLRASLFSSFFAFATTLGCCIAGLVIGCWIATASQTMKFYFQRALELLLAFPSLLLALSWAAVRGPGWDTLVVSLILGILPSFSRLIFVRAQELMQEDYVKAAHALGATQKRILLNHLFPGLVSICSIKIPILFAHALLAEATLSFLGVGAPIGKDTWGSLLADGKDYLIEAPHIALAAGIPLVLTLLALQLLTSDRTSRAMTPEDSKKLLRES